MMHSYYFNYIEEKLNLHISHIKSRGKLNLLDENIFSEDFYQHFLNKLFGWSLVNENQQKQNVEAIDLVDRTNKLVIQVSATGTKKKIEESLGKNKIKTYSVDNYHFKFVPIVSDAGDLRGKTFSNSHNIKFNPKDDIIDVTFILKSIKSLDIDKYREIYEFIKKELGNIDENKLDSNLAEIVNILAKTDLSNFETAINTKDFEIDRKIDYNELEKARMIIEDFSIYCTLLDKKYKEFDLQGVNKSISVLLCVTEILYQCN